MSTRLKYFLARLATDPDFLRAYHDDPGRTMDEAGLPAPEREALVSGDPIAVFELLDDRSGGKESPRGTDGASPRDTASSAENAPASARIRLIVEEIQVQGVAKLETRVLGPARPIGGGLVPTPTPAPAPATHYSNS